MQGVRKVAIGVLMVLLTTSILAPSAFAEVLTRGNKICVEYEYRPGYYKTTWITERIADFASAVAIYYTTIGSGGLSTAIGKAFVGGNVRYIVKQTTEWVPASTICLEWEYASAMYGNEYQF